MIEALASWNRMRQAANSSRLRFFGDVDHAMQLSGLLAEGGVAGMRIVDLVAADAAQREQSRRT
jgi:hypothetical protein